MTEQLKRKIYLKIIKILKNIYLLQGSITNVERK